MAKIIIFPYLQITISHRNISTVKHIKNIEKNWFNDENKSMKTNSNL